MKKHHRLLLLLFTAWIFSCGSIGGCDGCQGRPIPGGFPESQIYLNASQLRVTNHAFAFLAQNFESLLRGSVTDDLTFQMNESGSGSYRVCRNATCTATFDIVNTNFFLLPPSTVALAIHATVQTSAMPFEVDVPLLGWEKCDVTYDTGRSGLPDLHLTAHIDFEIDHADRRKLHIRRGESYLDGVERGDIRISGGVVCDIAESLLIYFEDELRDEITELLFDQVDNVLENMPEGQEGRFDIASAHPEPSSATAGSVMDYFLWAGGFALTEGGGLSLGGMAGFRSVAHNECVPAREAPAMGPLAPSLLLKGNTRPDGQGFHAGFSLHRQVLESALFALYDSGGLCLDLTSASAAQISSSFFTLLAPSIGRLTGGRELPLRLSFRPRYPFHVIYGKGTHHLDGEGNVVIDDPLIRLLGREVAIDLYLELDGRDVRLLSIVSDLDIPMLLSPTANGALLPVTGSLSEALFNPRVESSGLLEESPEDLGKVFPTLIGLATGSLVDVFDPIELPDVAGLRLVMDDGSVTTLGQDILAIFMSLVMVQNTSYDEPFAVEASLEALEIPPREAFTLGPKFEGGAGPTATLSLSARLSRALQQKGGELEFSYRVDGGFYRPWSKAKRVVVRDPLFWLPGEHFVDVRARLKGVPGAFSQQPTRVVLHIDPPPPSRTISIAHDATSSANDPRGGCSFGERPRLSPLWLAALALLLCWRRRPRG